MRPLPIPIPFCESKPVALWAATLLVVALATGLASQAQALPPGDPEPSDERQAFAEGLVIEGLVYQSTSQHESAVSAFRRSLLVVDLPYTHFVMARSLRALGRLPDAVLHYWRAIRGGGRGLEWFEVGEAKQFTEEAMSRSLVHLAIRLERAGSIAHERRVIATASFGPDAAVSPVSWDGLVPTGEIRLAYISPGGQRGELAVAARPGDRLDLVWRADATAPEVRSTRNSPEQLASLIRHLAGFEVVFPPPEAHAQWPQPDELARRGSEPSDASAGLGRNSSGLGREPPLAPEIALICDKPSPELTALCRLFEKDHKRLMERNANAFDRLHEGRRKLRAITSGGLIDTLR